MNVTWKVQQYGDGKVLWLYNDQGGNKLAEPYEIALVEEIEALRSEIRALAVNGIWQCKDYADGWINFPDEASARTYHGMTGSLIRLKPLG